MRRQSDRQETVVNRVDYRHVASYPAGLDASTPVARTVGQLVAGLCLWRAGDVAGSLEHFFAGGGGPRP